MEKGKEVIYKRRSIYRSGMTEKINVHRECDTTIVRDVARISRLRAIIVNTNDDRRFDNEKFSSLHIEIFLPFFLDCTNFL